MKKSIITIILALVVIAALVWACSLKTNGIAWFGGFFIAVVCGIKLYEVHDIDEMRGTPE